MVNFLFIFLFSYSIIIAQVKATAAADSSDYLIGDFISYTIEVVHDKKISVLQPSITDSLNNLELISQSSLSKEQNGNKISIYTFILAGYDSINTNIPPIKINYKTSNDDSLNEAFTNPVSFTIHSLPVKLEEEIKDVKEPITIPLDWKLILLYLAGAVLIGFILYLLYKKYRGAKKEEAKPAAIPPDVKALLALDELEKKQLWQKGEVKKYHSEITEIIRKYFEEIYAFPSLEIPTYDTVKNLREKNIDEEIIQIVKNFLENADMVKFAKYQPMDTINEEMMLQAKEIVNWTSKKVKPESEINV